MNAYSQMIGSFQRTGNFPLEADYIFNSLELLKEWESNPINKATLHRGLQKLVLDNGEQSIYWVVEKDGDLTFEKMILGETQTEQDPEDEPISEQMFQLEHSFNTEAQELVLNIKHGDNILEEYIPLKPFIDFINADLAEKIEHSKTIEALNGEIRSLQGQIETILAMGGGGGGSISKLEILTFKFPGIKGNTYVVNPNLLTEEELANGVDIPIEWEYNINLTNNDKQYLLVNGNQETVPSGTDLSYVLKGIKGSTDVQLKALSKLTGLSTVSDVLKITFGITVLIGNGGATVNINNLNTRVITPEIIDGKQQLTLQFDRQTNDDFRVFAIPANLFENPVLRDGNRFEIEGYTITENVGQDGIAYKIYKLNNVIHGSFELIISES